MKYSITAALIIATSIVLFSCQKNENDTTPDPSKVVFNITSPTEAQVVHNGDSIKIKGTVAYPSELHGYEVTITNEATNAVLYSADEHAHADNFSLDHVWVDNLSSATGVGLKVEITVEIDHDGTESKKEFHLSHMP